MPFSLIPFLLLVVPVLEIAVFIAVGSQIGILPTIAMILVTAIAGTILLRVQGFGLLERIRKTVDAGRMPSRDLVHGVMILVAGVLLLTPGFVTDTLGFLLFVPALRDLGWAFLKNRIVVVASAAGRGRRGGDGPSPAGAGGGDRTIDLDTADYSDESGRDTPWRRPNGD